MSAFGLYVHIPFCPQICPYCAFAVVRGHSDWHGRYVEAVCAEIESQRSLASRGPLHTVFFGGGTPTMLEPGELGRLLQAARACLGLVEGAEITVEANPGTVDRERFAGLLQAGVNRLSIGVQAFGNETLRRLGRRHSADDAERAFLAARQEGCENIGLDLICAVPGVPEEEWRYSVERAVELGAEHLSTYALTIEEGTPFAERVRRGLLQPLSEEAEAAAYEWTAARLERAGYEHYEVSNFARPGFRSRHNWGYWTGGEYLGVGLGAHSYADGRRWWNGRQLAEYVERVERGLSPGEGSEIIDARTARRERLWMGLRTDRGVLLGEGERRCLEADARFSALSAGGYLVVEEEWLRLTAAGFLLADALGVEIVEIIENSLEPIDAEGPACGAY